MSEDTAPVMTDPEDDQGSFFDDVLHIVTLDKYHSITLRVLTLEEQRKLSRIIANSKSMTNLDAGSWLAEKMIVDWKGPKFKGRPVTPENINKLPMSVANLIADKIQEINAPLAVTPSIE
jgi:hypothetical protein